MQEIFDSQSSSCPALKPLYSFLDDNIFDSKSKKGTNSSDLGNSKSELDSNPIGLSVSVLPTVGFFNISAEGGVSLEDRLAKPEDKAFEENGESEQDESDELSDEPVKDQGDPAKTPDGAEKKQGGSPKHQDIPLKTEPAPSFKTKTSTIVTENDNAIVFANKLVVKGSLSQPSAIQYGNDAQCRITYKGDLLETLEFKDVTGKVILKVVRDDTTRQLKLDISTATASASQLLNAAPSLGKGGVLTLVSNKDSSIIVDAAGRLVVTSSESEADKTKRRLIVLEPNKHQQCFVDDRLVGKLFLDSPYPKAVHVDRDEKNPEQHNLVTYRLGNTVTRFARAEDGKWNAIIDGNGQQTTVEGILEFDEDFAPVFKATDRSIKINDEVLLKERPSLSVLLVDQAKSEELLLSVFELDYEQNFLEGIEKKYGVKSIFELPEDKIKSELDSYKANLKNDLQLLREYLASERVFLAQKLTDLRKQNKDESDLPDKDLKEIWERMPNTKRAYERLVGYMEKHQIPEAMDSIENWKLPMPVGGPFSAPKDQHGNYVPSLGMHHVLKKDIKLEMSFDKMPTPDMLGRLRSINDWCVGIGNTSNELLINRDLTKVIPAMIDRGKYPSKWLTEECSSPEAKRNNLLQLIAICDEMREYGGAMFATRKHRNANLKYPPGCEEYKDLAGNVKIKFKWPDSASMSDADTMLILESYQRWKDTDGKEFDEEQKRLAQSVKDITEQAFYADIPLKGYAKVHADGPKKDQLQEIFDKPGPGLREFNLLSGDFDIEKTGGKYNLTIKCEPRMSNYNYLDLGASRVCDAKVTEFKNLAPGAMVAVISHGKVRCVPIEEAEELKTYQQILYVTEKVVTAAVELSMVLGGFSGAGLALYAGKAGLKAVLKGVGRGLLGGSGFVLNNSKVSTSDWGPGVQKVRSMLILTDVANGLRHSFMKPPPPAAYRSIALANLASSEWRFTKAIRGPLVKINELPEKSNLYKNAMMSTEVAFLGILGNEFYHKYIKSKEAPIEPSALAKSNKVVAKPELNESILGRPTKQNDQVRQQLAVLERTLFAVLGHNKGMSSDNKSAEKPGKLGMFEPAAQVVEKRIARLSTAKDYLDTIGNTTRPPDEKKMVDHIRKEFEQIAFAKKPDGMNELETANWIKMQEAKKTEFFDHMSKAAKNSSLSPAVRFSAVMAIHGLSFDAAEVNDRLRNRPYQAGKFDVIYQDKSRGIGTFELYDPIKPLYRLAVCSDPTIRLMASEMQLRLGAPDRDVLHMAGIMRGVINDPASEESIKIRAVENLTRIVQGLSEFEQTVFPKLDSAKRVAYLGASAGRAPQDLRRFLTELAGDKTQTDNVRVMAAKSLSVLSFPTDNSINTEFELLVKAYEKAPAEFAKQQLNEMKKQSVESQDLVERLESTVALIDLGPLGGLNTPEARAKALMKIVEMSTKKIASGKDLKVEDVLITAEAISRLQKDDIAALGPADQERLIKVLSLPEYQGVDLAKIQLLRKSQFFGEAQRAGLEAAILKLITPSAPMGDIPVKSQHQYVRMEAVKALVEANLVSPKSIATLKNIAMPGANNKTAPIEDSPAVRLESLRALAKLDNYTFKQAADACFELEKEPAIRVMSETYRLAQSFPVRNDEYRRRVASASERLRGTDKANWEKLGEGYLDTVSKGYEALPKTKVVEVMVQKEIPTNVMEKTGKPVTKTISVKEKQTIENPERLKHLEDSIFMKVLGRNPAEREPAEQALFLLLSKLYEGKEINWIPDDSKAVIKKRASDVVRKLLESDADNTTAALTVDRVKLLINDADTEPAFRTELLKALDGYVGRNGVKNPKLLQEHADYLAYLLCNDANQIEHTGSNPGARLDVQHEILKQMDKYRSRATTEALDIFIGLEDPTNKAVIHARYLLYKIRDSVKERYAAAPNCKLTDQPMLADRILKSFGTAAGCQDIVDTIFECTKGSAIKKDDPRITCIRLALGAKGVDVTYTASTFSPDGLKTEIEPKKATMNGAEMIRLSAAKVILEPENTGFSDRDRLNAYKTCLELMVEGKEEGYCLDSYEILFDAIKASTDPMCVMAFVDVILDGRKDGEHSMISSQARDILYQIMPDAPLQIPLADGRVIDLKKEGTRLFIEEAKDGKLLRATVESTSKDGFKINYTDTIFGTMKFGLNRGESLIFAKRILSGEAKDFLKPTSEQKKEAIEMIARLSQPDDDANHDQTARLAASRYLMGFLYPDGDARRLTNVLFVDNDGLRVLEEKLVVALSDLASEGNVEAKDLLLSIATHKRELVLKGMLKAIPYTKRMSIEAANERSRQIRFHLDCYEFDSKDFTFGGDIVRKGQVKKSSGNVMPPPPSPDAVERGLKELPKDYMGNPRLRGDIVREFAEVILALPKPKNVDGIIYKSPVYEQVLDKLVKPYKQIDKKRMEVWTDLVVQVAGTGNSELSADEYAVLTGVYLESAAALGTNAPCLKSFKFDQVVERLGRVEQSDLKLRLRQFLPDSLGVRFSTESGLRQAGTRAAFSSDPEVRKSYQKVVEALQKPLQMANLREFYSLHGKDYLERCPENLEDGYVEMAARLVDSKSDKALDFEGGNNVLAPVFIGTAILQSQKRFLAIKKFIEIAPPEVQLSVAKSLIDTRLAWVEELAFRAAGRVLKDGNGKLQQEANDLLKKIVDSGPDKQANLDRREKLKKAFAEITSDGSESNALFDSWKKDAQEKGRDADLQKILLSMKDYPEGMKQFRKGILQFSEKSRASAISLYIDALKKDNPNEIALMIEDILTTYRTAETQSRLIGIVRSEINNDKAHLTVALDVLKKKNELPEIQKDIEARIRELEKGK